MSQETPQPQPVEFDIELPPELETGVPADFAGIWHTPTSFILDFAAAKSPPQQQMHTETGATRFAVPARVVARVRIPPEQVFELARALTQQLDMWERETGKGQGGHTS